jgi:uncharacterized membrane protein
MYDWMNILAQTTTWLLFFASSVYGHIAFKFVSTEEHAAFSVWRILFSFWGVTASAAWTLSGLLWLLILSKNPLLTANSISALRYALIALAAVMLFKETLSIEQGVGIVLIMAGIYFVAQH